MAGLSARKAFSRSPDIQWEAARRPTSSPIPTAKAFCVFFEERCQKQGIFIFDEPESALSPARQIAFTEVDAANGRYRPLPDHHGHPLADADGLPERDAAAAVEVRTGAGDGEGDRSLQGHA